MGFSSHLLLFLLLHLFLLAAIITCRDISPGSTLYASNQNQIWSSSNNLFSLRFIPTTDKAYIAAIAYNDDIPIWQAGGADIFVDSGASLQFLSSGNLLLTKGSGTTIWESNTTGLGVSAASVEDTGNLVLKNGSITVWSSFDNPTDTIVPNQNFTMDKVLRSGQYSFRVVSSGNLKLKWNEIMYWTLGLNSTFNVSLTSPSLVFQTIGIVSISDLTLSSPYIIAYSSDYAEGNNIFRFLKLDSDGNLRIYSTATGTPTIRWSAVLDQCEVFGYCGNMGICSNNPNSNPNCGCLSGNFVPIDPKDSRKGCKRKVDISSCPVNLTMLELTHTQFLTYPPETNSQSFFSAISTCRLNCLTSSQCNASIALSDGTGLCYFKITDFMSGYQSPALPSTSYIKVCEPVEEGKGWRLQVWIIAIVVVASFLGLILLEGGLWWWCCTKSHVQGPAQG